MLWFGMRFGASFLFLCLLAAGCATGNLPDKITFPTHPRLACTAAEIAAWKTDPKRQKALKRVVAKADKLLGEELYVPTQGGDWIFYYACPRHNRRLKAESLTVHVCPKCKQKFTDERTVAAYRTVLNNRLNQQCYDLALAYALTGDERYVKPVRIALLKLVKVYPAIQRHDRWGRKGWLAVVGGRRYCQHLSEGIGAMKLAEAFDLIAPALDPKDRDRIAQEFLGKTAWEIHKYSSLGVVGGRNNHQTWFNATFATIGIAIGDEKLVRLSIDGKRGLKWQLQHSITDDGLWFEGTMDYHHYALQAIITHLTVLQRLGITFKDNKRLMSMWTAPLQTAWPDGSIPAINDSNPSNIRRFGRANAWAWTYFRDDTFKPWADGATPEQQNVHLSSAALRSAGLVVLRQGTGADAVAAMVDFGEHGGGHGHPDKLNLMLYAFGREIMPDPGRISYSVPEWKSWSRTTVAHNTVTVNGRNQFPTTGELVFFDDRHGYTATLVHSTGAYPPFQLKRFLVLTPDVLVDLFAVTGNREARFDWVAHCRGKPGPVINANAVTAGLGLKNGYQHIKHVNLLKGSPSGVLEFVQPSKEVLRVHAVDADPTFVFTGIGIGTTKTEKVPLILRRRTGKAAMFATIYDLSVKEDLAAVQLKEVLLSGKAALPHIAAAVSFTVGDRKHLVAVDFRQDLAGKTEVDGRTFKRVLVQNR